MKQLSLENNGTKFANMGLSNVARLQQSKFFDYHNRNYYARSLGSKLFIYKKTAPPKKITNLTEKQLEALSGAKFNGNLSQRSQKKILNIVQNWVDTIDYMNVKNQKSSKSQKNQIVLITLTLSSKQQHTDQYIKREMLNRFIIQMMRKLPFVNYLWKAEAQQNGNIHFHILIDKYFNKEDLQMLWNQIQIDNEYHPPTILSKENLGLPSTRIEALYNKDDSVAYVAKYIQKNEGKKLINGRLWGCSRYLSKLEPVTAEVSRDEVIHILENENIFDHQIYFNDYALIIYNSYALRDIKNYLYARNKTNVINLERNIEMLNSRALTVDFELRQTDWYNEVIQEFGQITAEYGIANNLFTNVS